MKQAKAEDLLCGLLWTCDMLTRPTFRNLTDSYEAWAYRNGLLKELHRLEKERFLERHGLGPDQRLYRLTQRVCMRWAAVIRRSVGRESGMDIGAW